MSYAKLLAVEIERFKSFKETTQISFKPLTIILGRNNCGKSTLIQSLLLLKQTLIDPRPDVMLRLDGLVDAFSVRELTFGWPAAGDVFEPPLITVQWESQVDVVEALSQAGNPDIPHFIRHANVPWLTLTPEPSKKLYTRLKLWLDETDNVAGVSRIMLSSGESEATMSEIMEVNRRDGKWECKWHGKITKKLEVELEHFIPYISIDRSRLGPRIIERAWYNAYLLLFAQPLEDLKALLADFHYLGSNRQPPPSLYRPATAAPNEVGVSGEFAAQLLYRRQNDIVHFLRPLHVPDGSSPAILVIPEKIRAMTMVEAVNQVMHDLSINADIRVHEIQEVGFRLMFGQAALAHVGRGLNSLLPLVELGVFADPLRFGEPLKDVIREEYESACKSFSHIALEEPEAHLHPKVASRLAHWLASLALSNRRLIVETHSDHLVRRLRGLAVRAGKDSALEQWLTTNVSIISVDQNERGESSIVSSHLTIDGGVAEEWPADFMDEASDEESAIYYAKLDKTATEAASNIEFNNAQEPEPDVAP